MVSPVRILYVNHTASISGAENSLLQLIRGLDRSRFEPSVLLPMPGRFLDRLGELGIAADTLALATPDKLRPDRILTNTIRLGRFVRRHRIELIHCNSFHAVKYACPLTRLTGTPLVGSVRDIIPFTRLTTRAILSCDRVVCVSKATADNLLSAGAGGREDRVRVIYNGVDLSEFDLEQDRSALIDELGLGDAPRPFVGMAVPLVPWKGQTVLLKAAREVRRRFSGGSFLLFGDATFSGPDYVDELRGLAAAPELEGRVHLFGFRTDIAAMLSLLDVVVCASTQPDPFPRAVIEAMSAGLPVVASRNGGIPESVVDGETGLLFEPGNAAELADKLSQLFADEPLRRRLGQAGRRRVEQRFTMQQHCRAMEALYEELLT